MGRQTLASELRNSRARTASATESLNRNTVDLHCGAAAKLCGRVDGQVGLGSRVTPWRWEFIDVCFSNVKRPPLDPPLLLLSSTKNVNVLALSREQG